MQRSLPFLFWESGSNLLVSDLADTESVIIQMDRNMEEIRVEGEEIMPAQGRCFLLLLRQNASLQDLSLPEALRELLASSCNAGAYGGELKDVLKEVTVMTGGGELLTIPVDKLEMGYRTSIIKTSGYLVLRLRSH